MLEQRNATWTRFKSPITDELGSAEPRSWTTLVQRGLSVSYHFNQWQLNCHVRTLSYLWILSYLILNPWHCCYSRLCMGWISFQMLSEQSSSTEVRGDKLMSVYETHIARHFAFHRVVKCRRYWVGCIGNIDYLFTHR